MDKARKMFDKRLVRRSLLLGAGAGLFGGGYLLGEHDGSPELEDLGDDRLQVYIPRDGTTNYQQIRLVDQWNKMHDDQKADIVELSPIADLTYSTVHSRLQSGDSSIDVVQLDAPWIAEFAGEGYIRELENVDPSGFIGRIYETGVVDEGVYALPFHSDVGMLYYRREFVTDEHVERLTDWRSLREVIDEIVPGSDFAGGITMQLDAYEGFTVNVWEYLLANGIDTAENGSIDFGTDSRAVELLEDMVRDLHPESEDGTVRKPYILLDSLGFDEDASLLAFHDGKTPFLRHWPRALQELQTCDGESEVGVMPMPGGGVLGGQSLAVSAFSRYPVASQALIEFMTGPVGQQRIFEDGGYAATRDEPYYHAIAQFESTLEEKLADEDEDADEDEVREALLENLRCTGSGESLLWLEAEQLHTALENAGRRPGVERYTEFSRVFHGFLHGKLESASNPGLDELEGRLRDAIEGR